MGNARQIKMGYIKKYKNKNVWEYTIPVCNVSGSVRI